MRTFLFALFIFSAGISSGQTANEYSAIDKLALKLGDSASRSVGSIAEFLNANFKTDSEKARALFFWEASTISYDIENMFAINFNETSANKVSKTLQTKKGICINYAEIFTAILTKLGINSVVIEGYTKQNGFTDYIPHAWCAAKIDNRWFLFDPTWGSGYISNGKFVKKVNEKYFKAEPVKLISSHMPFDYLWQFLNYPVSNQEFYNGNIQINNTKAYFDFEKEIANYKKATELEQLSASAQRIEMNGVKNAMIFDRLAYKKREIEYLKQTKLSDDFNNAVAVYNEGINQYNEFVVYRNKQFKPIKSDPEIQAMFDAAYNKITIAKNKLAQIKDPGANIASMMAPFQKSLDDTMTNIEEQKEWLAKYFSKGKFGRSTMFTKYTWMGIPLN